MDDGLKAIYKLFRYCTFACRCRSVHINERSGISCIYFYWEASFLVNMFNVCNNTNIEIIKVKHIDIGFSVYINIDSPNLAYMKIVGLTVIRLKDGPL